MKIIHIMGNLIEAGGVPSFVYDLCDAQVQQGQEVHLLCLYKIEEKYMALRQKLESKGIHVHTGEGSSLLDIVIKTLEIRKLLSAISLGETTVLNMHLKIGVLSGVLASFGKKHYIRVETYHSGYHGYWLQAKLMQSFIHRYIAVSVGATKELTDKFGIAKDKVVTIHNGVQVQNMVSSVYTVHDTIHFLSVGRFSIDKQFEIPIQGFTLANVNAQYDLIGDGEEMPKALAAAGKNTNIHFIGEQPRKTVFDHLLRSDVVVMSSKHEGNSIFLLEAMAMKCPLILSDISSFREVFHEEPLREGEKFRKCKWGYSVLQNDTQAYCLAFQDAVANKADLKKMSEYVTTIAKQFDILQVSLEYSKEYKKADIHGLC